MDSPVYCEPKNTTTDRKGVGVQKQLPVSASITPVGLWAGACTHWLRRPGVGGAMEHKGRGCYFLGCCNRPLLFGTASVRASPRWRNPD